MMDSHLILIGQPDAALGMLEHQKLRIGNLCGMATDISCTWIA